MLGLPPEFFAGEHTVEVWRAAFEHFRPRTASGHLGVEFVDAGPDHLIIEAEITDKLRQPLGLLHGGVSALLAETAASFHSVWGTNPTQVFPVGIELSISHVGSARSGRIRASARVLRRGRTTIVHEVRVEHVGEAKLLSVARVTNLYRKIGR